MKKTITIISFLMMIFNFTTQSMETILKHVGRLKRELPSHAQVPAQHKVVQNDGKTVIIRAQQEQDEKNTHRFALLARYNTDGSLDDSFGKKGISFLIARDLSLVPLWLNLQDEKLVAKIEDSNQRTFLAYFDSEGRSTEFSSNLTLVEKNVKQTLA